jgi:hypothetical protein
MALRGNKAATAAAPGAFEEEGAQPAAVQEAAAPAANDEAKPAATGTAVAPKASVTALTRPGKAPLALFEGLKDAMPRLDFGVLPRIVANAGVFQDRSNNNANLGDTIVVELVSFNDEFVLTPGVDNADAKELVAYSADGLTVDGDGRSCEEYLRFLREDQSYETAKMKQYTQLVGLLLEAKKGDKAVPTELIESLVLVSLSPQSKKNFDGFRVQEAVKVRLGKRAVPSEDGNDGSNVLVLSTEARSDGKNSWTVIKVAGK